MDRNHNFGLGSPSSSRTRQSSSSFSSRKSFFSGNSQFNKKASVGPQSISARSNTQSVIGVRSEYNIIESYGFQLPVLVNEALTFTEKTQNVSVMCDPNGWAWIVCGRRLLVWQYKSNRSPSDGGGGGRISPTRQSRSSMRRTGVLAQCRELTLPQCDIGHKATLVSVFLNEGQQMASCVAVSPTGDVRYWPSIAHDGSTVDASGILDGQEFDRLLNLPQQYGYLLVTTTCNLVLLQLQLVNGRHVLQHKTIRQPSGFLGGIGKKFASIIIGMNNGADKENKFVGIVCDNYSKKDEEILLTVLSDRWFQRWRLTNKGQNEQMLFEDNDVLRLIRVEFQTKYWNTRVDNSTEIALHMLDMHLNNDETYVLVGAVNSSHTPQMYYAIVVLSPTDESMELSNFIPLKITQFFSQQTERECLSLRFIVCRNFLYIYTDKVVYPLNLLNPTACDMEAEKIEFHMQEDYILNASVCGGQIPLFFSRTHGLICVTPGDFESSDFFNISIQSARQSPDVFTPLSETTLRNETMLAVSEQNLHMFDLDPDAMYMELKDEVSQLKAAFIYRLKRNNNMCSVVLNDLMRSLSSDAQTDAVNTTNQLDRIVVTIAEDLAEDIPAADPRWEQHWEGNSAFKHAIGSSSSLQILTQLKEKNLALRHFIEFLHFTGLWEDLTTVFSGKNNISKPTTYVIADINEKIIGAIALRTIQSKYAKLIDEAINNVVITQWKEKLPQGNLNAQDIFFVHLCKFQHIFRAFVDIANARIEVQQHATHVASLISDINTVVLQILNEIITFREKNTSIFTPIGDKSDACEFLPWTAMSNVTSVLNELIEISVKYGSRCANEVELKQRLYLQIYELIDIILDGKKNYLNSLRDTEKYNVVQQQFGTQRLDLISILIQEGQHEYAAKLAEKYLDFQSLLVICDETNDQERLDNYMRRFEDYDFSQFAINWHLRQNRQGEVFERFKGNQAALAQFMRDHPTLGWIQLIFAGDFERASKILFQLAQNETEILQRKKCMLSLAKLSSLAVTDTDMIEQVESINAELKIIEYQEQINNHLLESFGYDSQNQKVLRVDEIINLFICEENETATEREFRKAIELLAFAEEPYEARQKIWCAAILRDNWTDYDVNNAVDYLQNLLFFKLIEICHFMGSDLDSFLPPMNDFLHSSELGDLVENQSFQYLLKLVYEYTTNTFKKSDEMAIDN